MKQELIETTYEIVDEIKQSDAYKRLLECKKEIAENKEINDLVTAYKKAFERYEEAKQYGSYHPDLKQRQLAFKNQKEALYSLPIIIEYKQLEQNIQSMLNQVSREVATTISAKIKHPNEIGLIPKH